MDRSFRIPGLWLVLTALFVMNAPFGAGALNTGANVLDESGGILDGRLVAIPMPGIDSGDIPVRLTAVPSEGDPRWFVLTREGRTFRLTLRSGDRPEVRREPNPPEEVRLDHHEPPADRHSRTWSFPGGRVTIGPGGRFVIKNDRNAVVARGQTLIDARPVWSAGYLALLMHPTSAYRHGILGDADEAEAFVVYHPVSGGLFESSPLPPDTVFEARYPIWADVTGDDTPELLLTTGNAENGAAVRAYRTDGTLLASSPPIGTGYRWLHLLGAMPAGPNGLPEIFVVKTPHIGGILESYGLRGNELRRTRSRSGYSTHRIRSRNLDMAVLLPGAAGSPSSLLLPTPDFGTLRFLTPRNGEFSVISEIRLEGVLTTNLAPTSSGDSEAVAWGLDTGALNILIHN